MKQFITTATFLLGALAAQAQVTNGLSAKYSFNNGLLNDEVGVAHGNANGATPTDDRFGNANKAYAMKDGAYIALPDAPSLKSSEMTVSMWVKTDSLSASNHGHDAIYVVVNTTTSAYFSSFGIFTSTSSNNYAGICQDGPAESAYSYSTSPLALAQWQHVVLSMNTDSIIMHVDGNRAFAIAKNFVTDYSSDSVYIGTPANSFYNGHLNGAVDDIRVYNRILSDAEVDTLFSEPNPVQVGVQTWAAQADIAVYPNPTSASIHLNAFYDLSLYDSMGNLVKMQAASNQMNLMDLPTGMYILVLMDEQGGVVQRSKVVKY